MDPTNQKQPVFSDLVQSKIRNPTLQLKAEDRIKSVAECIKQGDANAKAALKIPASTIVMVHGKTGAGINLAGSGPEATVSKTTSNRIQDDIDKKKKELAPLDTKDEIIVHEKHYDKNDSDIFSLTHIGDKFDCDYKISRVCGPDHCFTFSREIYNTGCSWRGNSQVNGRVIGHVKVYARNCDKHWKKIKRLKKEIETLQAKARTIEENAYLHESIHNNTSDDWYVIRSCSSHYYLDGRSPSHNEVFLTNRNPKGDAYLNWIFEEVDGNFAIKSVSSSKYLDGRNTKFAKKDGAVLVTDRNPKGDSYLNWTFEEVDGNYALKSVSSGLYLNGRNSNFTGNKIWLTDGNPKEDKHLQWSITKI